MVFRVIEELWIPPLIISLTRILYDMAKNTGDKISIKVLLATSFGINEK
ncbi:MAG: hypothetical protein QW254_04670 [Desulfurococcaceae archaeon]